MNSTYKSKSLLTHTDKVLINMDGEINGSERAIAVFKKVGAAKTLLLYLTTSDDDDADKLARWVKTFGLEEDEFKRFVAEHRKKFHLIYCQQMIIYIRFCISNRFGYPEELRPHALGKKDT